MKFVFNILIDIGGTSASEELLDTVEVFFIVNEVWTVMVQSLPRTPASSAIVNINERMHLIGGLYGVYTQKRLRNIFISWVINPRKRLVLHRDYSIPWKFPVLSHTNLCAIKSQLISFHFWYFSRKICLSFCLSITSVSSIWFPQMMTKTENFSKRSFNISLKGVKHALVWYAYQTSG